MKKLLSISILIMLTASVFAQNPQIEFKVKDYDFGKIKEEDGSVSTTFEFTNTGVAPLVISGVTASCGCTTPEWTKEPVPAGGKGVIKATYNAQGRPGVFKKSITVRSNATDGTVVLTIAGEVIPKPKSDEEVYPVQMGGLRLKTKSTPLFDIYRGDSRTDKIEVKNTSDKDIKIGFAKEPKHLIFEVNPPVIKPGETGSIVITYNSKSINDYGSRTDYAYVVVNGKEDISDAYKLTINANLREDFRKLTAEEKAAAPVADFQVKSVNIDLKAGEKKRAIIELKNSGKEDLIIRKIKKDSGIAKASATKTTIEAGKTTQLKIEVDAASAANLTSAKVTVITNDPKNPTATIVVNLKLIK
ncbi:hypothetical protein FACS18945_4230 [Bacteroidia bacterium]|nr:hypothetical protein FACS18945_4230 [Bacteroidia bacterium]